MSYSLMTGKVPLLLKFFKIPTLFHKLNAENVASRQFEN